MKADSLAPRRRPGWLVLSRGAGLALLLACSGAPSEPIGTLAPLWQKEGSYALAPTALIFDIDLDGRLEIVQTAARGEISARDPVSGELLWRTALEDIPLYTPVAGHFIGNQRINLVVATRGNRLYILDGPTGRIENDFPIPYPMTLAPTAFPWSGEEGPVPYREGILLYDPGNKLRAYLINEHNIDQILELDTGGALTAPPAVGRLGLDGPLPHVAFTSTSGAGSHVTAFCLREPVHADMRRLSNDAQAEHGVTLADLDGDGTAELVLDDRAGYLHGFRIQGDKLQPVWTRQTPDGRTEPAERVAVLQASVHAPVAIDVNGDGAEDLLLPRVQGYDLIDGRTGTALWKTETGRPLPYLNQYKIFSPPALLLGDQRPMAVFFDERNICLLDLRQRSLSAMGPLPRSAVATPLAGSLLGDGRLQCFAITESTGQSLLFDMQLAADPQSPPWSGELGGSRRTGHLDPADYHFRTLQMERLGRQLDLNLQEARELAARKDWRGALELLDRSVLSLSPSHAEALKLKRYYFLRKNMAPIVAGSLIGLAALLAASWLAFRTGRAAWLGGRARRAQQQNRPAQAIAILRRLCRMYPRQGTYAARLADIYLHERRFDEESADAFARAVDFFPQENRYIKALATAYSSGPRQDAQAARIYGVMTGITSKPGPWFFILGQTLQAIQQPREALDAYRQAIIHQYEDDRLPDCMTDLYIQLGITSPEILPTLGRVFARRNDDPAFLRIYCRACQQARRYDDDAQGAALRLLELDPEAPSAHAILATRLLQAGRHKEALQHAQQILQVNANDSIGLRLLGACYAAENRLDETAMEIFDRAMQANPDATEILIAVSHGYIQQGREDAEARATFIRTLQHHPQDETLLRHLAQIARNEKDDELTVRTVETLLAMGHPTRELTLQLADAYCRLGIVEDRVIDIYREALILQPDHATVQENLAAIFLRHERTDLEAAQVYEHVLERTPDRLDIGLQLMRCYQTADLPERALALGERLSVLNPENAELQKLLAACSEKADQMETAIAGYERVLAANPGDREAVLALSSLYGRKRRDDNAAIEIHNQAIRLDPRRPGPYLAVAHAYATRGSADHAIQIVRNMLTRCPDQVAAAIELLSMLAELQPAELTLRWYLIDTLIFAGHLGEGRRHVAEVARLDPSQSEACLKALDRILDKNPRDALAHLESGRLHWSLDRLTAARQAMEQAHRFRPDSDEVNRSLLGLYQKILEQQDSPEVRFQLGRLAMRLGKQDLAISCFQATSRDYRWEGESVRNLARCFMEKGMLDLALQELKRLAMEQDVKELMYELGQRYEAVGDIMGAREVYKLIFAADITYKDVKGKLETLSAQPDSGIAAERTAILDSLSDKATRRYDLMEELGRGAMGIVYKAHDRELEEVVALKILPDSMIKNQEAVRRFRQEARSARRLSHANIVRIHDIGEELGRKYISMEFVEGSDLKHKLRAAGRKLALPDVVRYAAQIAEALAYAHSMGIVHRDIKPANLMLTRDDQIKVTDFGIAKMIEDTADVDSTVAGQVMGTPLYMSPEQVKGEAVNFHSDIYSMGVVFYEMASGWPPFTEGDLARQHLLIDPKPLTNVPAAFGNLILRCLAKKPEDRPADCAVIAEELRAIQATLEINPA